MKAENYERNARIGNMKAENYERNVRIANMKAEKATNAVLGFKT